MIVPFAEHIVTSRIVKRNDTAGNNILVCLCESTCLHNMLVNALVSYLNSTPEMRLIASCYALDDDTSNAHGRKMAIFVVMFRIKKLTGAFMKTDNLRKFEGNEL